MPGVTVESAVWLREYNAHYYDLRAGRALPVLRVQFADEANTWLYLDPARGSIVQRTDDTRRLRRWLYQGLHSLDFPFLYYKRPVWDIVVIVLSIGGAILECDHASAVMAPPASSDTSCRWRATGDVFTSAVPDASRHASSKPARRVLGDRALRARFWNGNTGAPAVDRLAA